jgi:DNA-binding NtrC family response regulator
MDDSPRILVVDDEDSVLAALRRRFERLGYEVMTASTAADGIRLISNSEIAYDVILTDMSIEDPESGIAVLDAAIQRDVLAAVIVMTAYGSVGNAVECMRRGAFDYVEKNSPAVDVFELLPQKVEGALARRQQDLNTVARWDQS